LKRRKYKRREYNIKEEKRSKIRESNIIYVRRRATKRRTEK